MDCRCKAHCVIFGHPRKEERKRGGEYQRWCGKARHEKGLLLLFGGILFLVARPLLRFPEDPEPLMTNVLLWAHLPILIEIIFARSFTLQSTVTFQSDEIAVVLSVVSYL